MKKSCKRLVTFLIVIALVSVLSLTAFAATWERSGIFSGADYHGEYVASVNATEESAVVKLAVSNYTGPVVFDSGATVKVTVYYIDKNGNRSSHDDTYTAIGSDSETWTITYPVGTYTVTNVSFEFSYMTMPITFHMVTFS